MFRKALSLFLILLILSTGFTGFFMRAGYMLNKDYITKIFCVNKAKPQMHCNGKCYLAKKIKEAEQADQKQQQGSSKHFFVDVYLISRQKFKCYTQQIGEFKITYQHTFTEKNINAIFHPPKV